MALQTRGAGRSANWLSDMRALRADATIGSSQTQPRGFRRALYVFLEAVQFGVGTMQQQQYDLLDPGRARLGTGDATATSVAKPYRGVQSFIFSRVAAATATPRPCRRPRGTSLSRRRR